MQNVGLEASQYVVPAAIGGIGPRQSPVAQKFHITPPKQQTQRAGKPHISKVFTGLRCILLA
jgi:hypothetical protein